MPLTKKKGKRARRPPRNPPAMLPEAEQAEWKAFLSQFMPSAEHRAQVRRFRRIRMTDEEDVAGRIITAFSIWEHRRQAQRKRAKERDDDKGK